MRPANTSRRSTVQTPPFNALTRLAPEPRQSYIGSMNLDLIDEEHAAWRGS